MTRIVRPMLASLTKVVIDGPGWVFEEKYDGYRILAYKRGKDVLLVTRNLLDYTAEYPEVADAVRALPMKNVVLDGEVVVTDAAGNSSFSMLQHADRRGRRHPTFAVFDILEADGEDLLRRPWTERRAALEALLPAGRGTLRRSRILRLTGPKALDYAREKRWEGIIAKKKDGTYIPDARSPGWLKMKLRNEAEFVIGGFKAPGGGRKHFGALLVGLFDGPSLRYVGKVGTGFPDRTLAEMARTMKPLITASSPFDPAPREPGITWVKPTLVAQVEYAEWTAEDKLRQPSFLGLRTDKSPQDVTWTTRDR